VNNERTFYKDVYCAMPSLSRFTKLSKLAIPFRQAFDDLHNILQPLLRELTLLHPGPVQASDLAHIINHYIVYRNLRRFDLYCAPDDNVVLSDRTVFWCLCGRYRVIGCLRGCRPPEALHIQAG
jgi:hypothetical protein